MTIWRGAEQNEPVNKLLKMLQKVARDINNLDYFKPGRTPRVFYQHLAKRFGLKNCRKKQTAAQLI
jgi:hypothetical protein